MNNNTFEMYRILLQTLYPDYKFRYIKPKYLKTRICVIAVKYDVVDHIIGCKCKNCIEMLEEVFDNNQL